MNYEQNRLDTFPSNWQHPFAKKEILAKTGFYFVREPDFVTCQFCGVHLHKFDREDTEVPLHLAMSVTCPLLRRRPNQNVPLGSSSELEELISYIDDPIARAKKMENNREYSYAPYTHPDKDADKPNEPPSGECCCKCHKDSPKRKNHKTNE